MEHVRDDDRDVLVLKTHGAITLCSVAIAKNFAGRIGAAGAALLS